MPKDIKESRNYEKKKQTKKRNSKLYDHTNPLEQEILALKAANNNSAKEDTKTDSNKQVKETNSVGVQVNLIQAAALTSQPSSPVPTSIVAGSSPAAASPSLARRLAHIAREPEEMNLDRHLLLNLKSNYESKTLPRRKSNNDVTR